MKNLIFPVALILILTGCSQPGPKPNILLIITDDQGYGDLGYHGNPIVQTPNLDSLAENSVKMNNFYVSPVCALTRASLMTGRYSLRTGVHDTYNGGAVMATEEVTMAEVLKDAGYSTGAFGKWHLGDNHPCRPGDQGFEESVIHLAGGMGQPGDFTTYFRFDSSYFDPVLWHNGLMESYEGYCSDIFTNEAIGFIEENKQGPFFCYLSYNAPHTPLQVPDEYYIKYKNVDPALGFENENMPFPEMTGQDKEDARKVYAMVSNIDDNIGRMLKKLNELGIAENTMVIFMTDNGPQQARYVGGFRGRKGSVYQGGIRVPCFIHYPGKLSGGRYIEGNAAHIDILPTLASVCGAPLPEGVAIDGIDLWPLISGSAPEGEERTLFFYWSRKYPELYSNVALMNGPYKLIGNTSFDAGSGGFQLYDLHRDPYELDDISVQFPGLAEKMKREMDVCLVELTASPHLLSPPRIIIGSGHENPVYLNRNDATGERGIWTQEDLFGKWLVRIVKGRYDVKFVFIKPVPGNGTLYLETGPLINRKDFGQEPADRPDPDTESPGMETDRLVMENVSLPGMDADLVPFYLVHGKRYFPLYLQITRIDR